MPAAVGSVKVASTRTNALSFTRLTKASASSWGSHRSTAVEGEVSARYSTRMLCSPAVRLIVASDTLTVLGERRSMSGVSASSMYRRARSSLASANLVGPAAPTMMWPVQRTPNWLSSSEPPKSAGTKA